MLIKPSDVSNDGTGLVSGIPFTRCSDPFPLEHNWQLANEATKIHRRCVPLFYIRFWKVLSWWESQLLRKCDNFWPRSSQQTLLCTANIWSLVAREQKHCEYIGRASKPSGQLWKLDGTWWQMSPVFYHYNGFASQNKLLKSSRCLFSNIVDLFGEIIIRLFRRVGDLDVEMCELQLSLFPEVKRAWLSIPCMLIKSYNLVSKTA